MSGVGEWVFRHAGGCLIDIPDLPVPPRRPAWRWVATRWPDPLEPHGWAALEWARGERGWQLPYTLAIGDVLEFGITSHDAHGRYVDRDTVRWYGWVDHATDHALIVNGPYWHPAHACTAAQEMIGELRLAQLDPPDVDLATVEYDPHGGP